MIGLPAAVLWDMDGTLVDTEPFWIKAEHRLVALHGNRRWTDADGHSLVGLDLHDSARQLQRIGGVQMPADDIVEWLMDDVVADLRTNGVPWRPGARELLDELYRTGIPSALVTMSWQRLAMTVVDQLPAGHFAAVVSGDDVEHGKPHPEPYLTAAELLAADPRQCVALEDSPNGIASAMAAGCRTVAIPNMVPIDGRAGLVIVRSLADLGVDRLVRLFDPDATFSGSIPATRAPTTGFAPPAPPATRPDVATTALSRPAVHDAAADDEFDDDVDDDVDGEFDGVGQTGPNRVPAPPTAIRGLGRVSHRATGTAPRRPSHAGILATFNRRLVGALLAVVLVAVAAVWWLFGRTTELPPLPDIPINAWVPGWQLDTAAPSLDSNSRMLTSVSPFWYEVDDADPNTIQISARTPTAKADALVALAKRRGLKVIPSIVDNTAAGTLAKLFADATTRTAHVDSIVAFVNDHGFDGIDVDYESFAFKDDKATWLTTRVDFAAFVKELAERLHGDGKLLTLALPPINDTGPDTSSGYRVYDYRELGKYADQLRIMAYDYSVTVGPISPYAWNEKIIAAAIQAVGDRSKIVLGVPLYGYNWRTNVTGTCPASAPDERNAVTQGGIDDLIAKRAATVTDNGEGEGVFTYDLTLSEGSATCTQTREVHFMTAAGARQRIDLARKRRLGGVALWALGYDSAETWKEIADIARSAAASTTTTTKA